MNQPKIAYLILAHTDPIQLERLVKAIDYHATIFIHVDLKSDIDTFKKIPFPPHVHFIKERTNVFWGGFKMIEATLYLMRAALASQEKFSRIVLLSGLDYPIKPIEFIYDFFVQHPTRQFIKFLDVRESEFYTSRIVNYYFKDINLLPVAKLNKVIGKGLEILAKPFKNKIPNNLIPCFGSQWWALTPECVEYALDYVDKNPAFSNFFRYTFAPDEFFFHTIIGNSPFLKDTDGFQKFTGRGTYKMANLHIIHPSLAKYYDENDFEEVKNSDKLFVRKVNTALSSKLLDLIDKELLYPIK
jgi:hypothetical protein